MGSMYVYLFIHACTYVCIMYYVCIIRTHTYILSLALFESCLSLHMTQKKKVEAIYATSLTLSQAHLSIAGLN